MPNTTLGPLLFAFGLLGACQPDYGEEPAAGTTTLASIEQAFTTELYVGDSPTGVATERAVVSTYNPAPGQICFLYGLVSSGPAGGGLDLAQVPVYTAQVFSGDNPTEGPYFYGALFRHDPENGWWERFGEYKFYPYSANRRIIVSPADLPSTTSTPSGDDVRDLLTVLNACQPLEGDATYIPLAGVDHASQ